MTALTILILSVAYLAGSVSSAILVCKLLGLADPRQFGSGNPGATNVLRLGGRYAAALVFVFDLLKGTLPVWIGYELGFTPLYLGLIAVAACLGHIFPLFFGFRGGKAVATAFGALLPLGLELAGALVLCWAVVAFVTRYSSLAAIVAVSLSPIFTYFIKPEYTLPVLMLAVLIVVRHKDNIVRLIAGTETKINI